MIGVVGCSMLELEMAVSVESTLVKDSDSVFSSSDIVTIQSDST